MSSERVGESNGRYGASTPFSDHAAADPVYAYVPNNQDAIAAQWMPPPLTALERLAMEALGEVFPSWGINHKADWLRSYLRSEIARRRLYGPGSKGGGTGTYPTHLEPTEREQRWVEQIADERLDDLLAAVSAAR